MQNFNLEMNAVHSYDSSFFFILQEHHNILTATYIHHLQLHNLSFYISYLHFKIFVVNTYTKLENSTVIIQVQFHYVLMNFTIYISIVLTTKYLLLAGFT